MGYSFIETNFIKIFCALLAFINIFWSGILYGEELSLTSVIPGNRIGCVALKDDYVYYGDKAQNTLSVADISDPTNPQILSSISVLTPYQLVIHDNIAIVASRDNDLCLVDVSDPYDMSIISRYDTIEYCCKVDVSNNLLFATNRRAGLELIDISDKSMPQFVSKIELQGESQGVIVQGQYAYVSQWSEKRIDVIDISDPAKPVKITDVPLGGHGQGLDVRGNLLCAATGEGSGCGMDVFDLTIPFQPVFLGGR